MAKTAEIPLPCSAFDPARRGCSLEALARKTWSNEKGNGARPLRVVVIGGVTTNLELTEYLRKMFSMENFYGKVTPQGLTCSICRPEYTSAARAKKNADRALLCFGMPLASAIEGALAKLNTRPSNEEFKIAWGEVYRLREFEIEEQRWLVEQNAATKQQETAAKAAAERKQKAAERIRQQMAKKMKEGQSARPSKPSRAERYGTTTPERPSETEQQPYNDPHRLLVIKYHPDQRLVEAARLHYVDGDVDSWALTQRMVCPPEAIGSKVQAWNQKEIATAIRVGRDIFRVPDSLALYEQIMDARKP